MAAALGLVGAFAPASLAAPAKASGPKCFGKRPTIVVAGSHKTVKGTKKSDVIDAYGTGVTVLGLGGNDLICVGNAKKVAAGDGNDKVQFASGNISGGKGNDTLIQKGKTKGKTVVFGNDGNDTIALSKPNATVDSGAGLDILTVPPQFLESTTILGGEGLIVNGVAPRIDAPTGAPTAEIAYNGDPGPVVFAPTIAPENVLNPYIGQYLSIGHVVPKNGRLLSAWSVNFGDGYVQSGQGGLPAALQHPFVVDGSHVITATQTDSAGGITTRSITVSTSHGPTVTLGAPTFAVGTGNASFPTSATAGTGASITSWFIDFGDGTSAGGPNSPPNPILHTYQSSDFGYSARLYVTDDHGNAPSASRAVSYDASNVTTTLALAATVDQQAFLGAHSSQGQVPTAPLSNPATVFPGESINLYTNVDGPFAPVGINWGDGCSFDLPYNGVNPVVTGNCSANPYALIHDHSYSGPGTRTITVRLHKDATAANDIIKTWTVTVVARQTVAELSRAGSVQQGLVTMSTAGTTIAAGPSQWYFSFGDDTEPIVGSGAPPASFTHVYPSGIYYPELVVSDHYGMSGYAEGYIDASGLRARWQYFGGGGNARWIPALQATDASGTSAVCFSGGFVPSAGARPQSAQIDFGDGTSQGAIRGFQDGYFSCGDADHGYSTTGEFNAIVAGRDTKGQVGTEREHVSVAGQPTLGFPETLTITASEPTATTVPLSVPTAANNGANANPDAWYIDWADNPSTPTTQQGGYGAVASTLAHSYPNPGPSAQDNYELTVEIRNDHGGTVTRYLELTVIGA